MKMGIGDRVKDTISGFSGVVTGRTEYRNGCRQFFVSPEKLDKEGKPIDSLWIDEQSLEVVTAGIFADPFAAQAAPATAGGPSRSKRLGE